MRIGLVLDRFDRRLGGVEQWTAQLADRLLARGHEIHVVARSIAEQEYRPNLMPHPIARSGTRLEMADAAAELLRGLDLDIIHDMGFGWYCDLLQPHGGSRRAGIEQNLRLGRPWLRSAKRIVAPLLPRYRQFEALCRKQYAVDAGHRPGRLVVAISQMVRRDLRRLHDVPTEALRLVYNGVQIERFTPDLRHTYRSAIRSELGVGGETLYLIVAHNFELKGVPALLRAMALLRAAAKRVKLVVVGGKSIGTYQRMVQRMGIADCVKFAGSKEDPTPYYAAADVYVQPTFYDPCSLVVLEALACGLPVITTRFNGAGELMTPGVHGEVLSDPADEVSLAAAMDAWRDGKRQLEAAPLARELMEQHTLDHNVDQIMAVYQEILARRQNPGQNRPEANRHAA